ncbi:DUF4189 domain-containing protein [Luteibacter sp. W1I16]|uniref:DUF4189 domain-containing protein n=1 Tax=Luteibacter sp. W1I16 TaxID=3373922 RepID=UPI003D1D652B
MRAYVKIALLAALSRTALAYAEGGCPPGQVPQQGNGWRSCIPVNGASQQQGPSDNFVGPQWTARWISVAVDTDKAILGKSAESRTEAEAENSAVRDCASQGGLTCHAIVTAKNGCVAMVVGNNRLTTAGDPIQRKAEAKAIDSCKSSPDTNCTVYYSACVQPVPE